MNWNIIIGKNKLGILDAVEIHKSVDLLSDTAHISIPDTVLNRRIGVRDKIKCGDAVAIDLGYNAQLHREFSGFVEKITNENGIIKISCEDAAYLTRQPVKDIELTSCSLQAIIEYVVGELGQGITLVCDYPFEYDTFIIKNQTGYDVLARLREDTKANVFFRGNELHVHPAYQHVLKSVRYDSAINIENSKLQYKTSFDKLYKIVVGNTDKSGKHTQGEAGKKGGEIRTITVSGISDKSSLDRRAEEELKRISYDGCEGTITTFLFPFVENGYLALLQDKEDESLTGKFYVNAVTTSFSPKGGIRKLQLGMMHQ